jgi:quercetin dioxygenase-like cupin family protein
VSAFDSVSSLNPRRIWDGVHARVVHGDRLSFSIVELDADGIVPEHSHEHEQLGMVLTGSLSFRIGEETQDLGPGAIWSIPSNTPHEVHVGPDGAVVIDVFAPTRDDWREAPQADERPPRWPGSDPEGV